MSGVIVLLGSYNGSLFIDEQLSSIYTQTNDRIDIVVSDDKSSDGTLDVLTKWQKKWSKGTFELVTGPCKGFAENFRSLILADEGTHDFVAFSDQDDIWDTDKLETATAWLAAQGDCPALYCGRTRYVDETGAFLRLSPLFGRPPHFRNALLQCIAGGNTMVLNRPAMELVKLASRSGPFVSHDWWSYLIVTGCGGRVLYDSAPCVSYRQHEANIIGANDMWVQRWFRVKELFRGRFRQWTEVHLSGLSGMKDDLTAEARQAIDALVRVRSQNVLKRVGGLLGFRLYRQTLIGNLGLIVAIIFGKI